MVWLWEIKLTCYDGFEGKKCFPIPSLRRKFIAKADPLQSRGRVHPIPKTVKQSHSMQTSTTLWRFIFFIFNYFAWKKPDKVLGIFAGREIPTCVV